MAESKRAGGNEESWHGPAAVDKEGKDINPYTSIQHHGTLMFRLLP